MTDPINYIIFKGGEEHSISITPVNQGISGGDIFLSGVFKLSEGEVGMGEIIFDDKFQEWEYEGAGSYLNYQDAAEIASFIQVKASSDF
jgi:hypothetical protein